MESYRRRRRKKKMYERAEKMLREAKNSGMALGTYICDGDRGAAVGGAEGRGR